MARSHNWRKWVGAAVTTTVLGGCGTGTKPAATVEPKDPPPVASIPGSGPIAPSSSADPKMHMPFDDACVSEINKNVPLALPPDVTSTGKNCGQLNDAVARIWNSIKFIDSDGKPQTFVAEIEVVNGTTPMGTIELLMRPEIAPNHVRNFVALATLNYYDGLRFDRIVKQSFDQENGQMGKLVVLEAGAPIESAEPERSHLGYWLRPEFNADVKHEEGSVGACLLACEDNEETAAVRFYIALTPAPAMDHNFSIFAKVTKGLDVVRAMSDVPSKGADAGPEQGRPNTPLTIKKIAIRAVPVVQ